MALVVFATFQCSSHHLNSYLNKTGRCLLSKYINVWEIKLLWQGRKIIFLSPTRTISCVLYLDRCLFYLPVLEQQSYLPSMLLLLLLPDPFRGMGAWPKTMQPQMPGNSTGHGPEVVKRQRVPKERATQRVRSWTVQNEMRDVLGPVSAGAKGRILDSVNPRDIRTQQKAMSVAAKTRENTASVTRKHKFLCGNRGNMCVNEFR